MQKMIIQGPLAGYSCAPFRKLIWQHGSPDFCCTEMISSKDLRHRKDRPNRYLARDPVEKTLCYQLSGNNPDDLAYATEAVSKEGADIVDLNCGCPKKKIRSKNSGTKLLTNPELLHNLVKAMKTNTDAKVSIKIRVSDPVGDHDDLAVIDAAQQAGVDFITVHGRHWTERYDVPSRSSVIKRIKEYASVPVIANGDAEDSTSVQRILTETGCDGVMICRASVGRPWLIAQIQAELAGERFEKPSLERIGELFIQHLKELQALDGEHLAVLKARTLAKYYGRNGTNWAPFVIKMQQCQSMREAQKNIIQFFEG